MAIGNLGKLITFEVSTDSILTIEKMTQTVKGRWTTHAVIGNKPEAEFLGPDVRSITMPVFLSSMHGVKPRTVIEAIEDAVEKGEYYQLVIGGKAIGSNKWRITNASETWSKIMSDGSLIEAKVTLTLEEYV